MSNAPRLQATAVRISGAALKLAAAPISWGVCEVPGWGWQMDSGRVLQEAAELGFDAIEAGPPGFLVGEGHLRVVAGFLAADQIVAFRRQASWLAGKGAEALVLGAVATGSGYEDRQPPDEETWTAVANAGDACSAFGLELAVHPHFGTQIETAADVEALLELTDAQLCVDTGHFVLGGADPLAMPVDRIALIHLKDIDLTLAQAVRERQVAYGDAVRQGLYRPLGRGAAEIAAFIRTTLRRGYAGWWVLEQDCVLDCEPEPGDGPIRDVARSLEFIREL